MNVNHRPDCHNPEVSTFRGAHGDLLARCEKCRRFAVVEPAPATDKPNLAPTPAPFHSSWRCREHPNRPVSWKGTGCPDCQRDRALSRTARARRRQGATTNFNLGETR